MEPTNEWLQSRAKAMRRAPVLYERRMWALLRGRHLDGLKFQRQRVIGRYIVDFVCFRHRLIVEADGPQHEDRVEDAARDAWLAGQGFRVLRFRNSQIENHRHEVIAAICAAAIRSPSPLAGGGGAHRDPTTGGSRRLTDEGSHLRGR
jgi:very-short-patch-repair endonuclease